MGIRRRRPGRRPGARSGPYAYGVTGELDAVLIGNFKDMVEYQDTCDRLFDGVEGIVRYTTHFVAETYKAHPSVPCDAISKLDFAHSCCMADGLYDTEEAVGLYFLLV